MYPDGMRKMLKWVKDNYDDPEVFITENGYSDDGEINDIKRIKYFQVMSNSCPDTDTDNSKSNAFINLLFHKYVNIESR